jgi:hypothetical protein
VVVRPSDQQLVDMVGAAFDGEVVTLVDPSEGVQPIVADPVGSTWPAAALGRYVKYHEFDHVVAVVDEHDESTVAARIARDLPVHVWYRDAIPPGDRVPALARSVAAVPRTPAATSQIVAATLS